jgi:hypothetical protein
MLVATLENSLFTHDGAALSSSRRSSIQSSSGYTERKKNFSPPKGALNKVDMTFLVYRIGRARSMGSGPSTDRFAEEMARNRENSSTVRQGKRRKPL